MSAPAEDMQRWLAAAHAGSATALGEALQACRRYLLLVANSELDSDLRGKGGGSDLVQETFLEAQRDFARFHGTDEGELRAWLRQILLNNLGNFTRRFRTDKRDARREVALDSANPVHAASAVPDSLLTPGSHAIEREQLEALQGALARLPEDYRRVLVLRFHDGHSFDEIGRRLDRSAEAARKLWSRAMERLQDEWEGADGSH